MLYLGLKWSREVRVAPAIVLSDEEKAELTRLSRSGCTSVRLAQRARIVLLAAQGMQNKDIAQELSVGRVQVARWRERYLQAGVEGIERDLARGAPPVKVNVAQLVELTTQSKPAAATHWSVSAGQEPLLFDDQEAVFADPPASLTRHRRLVPRS
jgi:transposase-like protein